MTGGWAAHKGFQHAMTNHELTKIGTCPWNQKKGNRGRRTDLIKIHEELTNGKPLEVVVRNHPEHAKRFAKNMKRVYSHHRARKPRVIVLGVPESKNGLELGIQFCKYKDTTYFVQEEHKEDGYSRQEAIVAEELHRHITAERLIKFLNGSVPEVKTIILVSTDPLEQWYKGLNTNLSSRLLSSIDLNIWKDGFETKVLQKSDEE